MHLLESSSFRDDRYTKDHLFKTSTQCLNHLSTSPRIVEDKLEPLNLDNRFTLHTPVPKEHCHLGTWKMLGEKFLPCDTDTELSAMQT